MSVTTHLPVHVAEALLEQHGWTVEVDFAAPAKHSATPRAFSTYTRPGGVARRDGGSFDKDYLWEIDEALTIALTDASGVEVAA